MFLHRTFVPLILGREHAAKTLGSEAIRVYPVA